MNSKINELSNRELGVYLFSALSFLAFLLIAVITSVKVQTLDFFGFKVMIPLGTYAFALTYLFTDVISEVFGKRHSLFLVAIGVVLRFVMIIYFYISVNGESMFSFVSQASFWSADDQAKYEFVLTSSNFVTLIGMISFLVSALLDVQLYHYFKDKHSSGNKLWLRNIASTSLAQIVNSIIFIGFVFGGKASIEQVLLMILGQFIIKIIVSFLDTPFVYFFRNIAQKRKIWDYRG